MTKWRWRWIQIRHPWTECFFLHHAATAPAGHQNIYVWSKAGYDNARLVWKVCHECRHGLIAKISIGPDWHRQGLGALLIHRALQDGPDYRWTTSSQSPDGKQFFAAMSARTGAAFTPLAGICAHIRDAQSGHPKASLDRMLQKTGWCPPHSDDD